LRKNDVERERALTYLNDVTLRGAGISYWAFPEKPPAYRNNFTMINPVPAGPL
jgi:hypothetical protein